MLKLALTAAFALCVPTLVATPLSAQNPAPTSGDKPEEWGWETSQSHAPQTWYAMIAVEQAIGPAGCDTYHYKVSTRLPIVVQGPPEVRAAHADELTAWWMLHVEANAPLAYRWLTSTAGHKPPQVYFRKSAREAFEAFRNDGHLRKNRQCLGAMLTTLDPEAFEFTPPPGFAQIDFGNDPTPQNVTVAKSLSSIPGSP